jgi:hypothetical protein
MNLLGEMVECVVGYGEAPVQYWRGTQNRLVSIGHEQSDI